MAKALKEKQTITKRAVNKVKKAPQKLIEHTVDTALKTVEKAAEKQAKRQEKAISKKRKESTDAPKQTITKRAVNKVKKAPQKLIEHTVDTALKTVEKAAEKQAKRQEKAISKKIEKTTQKAISKNTPSKQTTAKRTAQKVKTQIKEILSPENAETFYYSQQALIALTLLYAIIAILVYILANGLERCGCLSFYPTLFISLCITVFLTLCALGSAVFVMIYPPKVAVVTNKSIKIDHNVPLLWEDVELAEEKYSCQLTRRPLIALHLKQGVTYPLTFMQKLCKHNVFTPFSIPLYALDEQTANRLRELVKHYAPYKNSCKK